MIKRFEEFSRCIADIHRAISKIQREEMIKRGYKGIFAPCLVAIYNTPEGITAAALGRICNKDKASISRIIAEMEEKNLIIRSGEASLYRAKLILTEKGKRAAKYVCQKAVVAVGLAGKDLEEKERDVFYNALRKICNNLKKLETCGLPETAE